MIAGSRKKPPQKRTVFSLSNVTSRIFLFFLSHLATWIGEARSGRVLTCGLEHSCPNNPQAYTYHRASLALSTTSVGWLSFRGLHAICHLHQSTNIASPLASIRPFAPPHRPPVLPPSPSSEHLEKYFPLDHLQGNVLAKEG